MTLNLKELPQQVQDEIARRKAEHLAAQPVQKDYAHYDPETGKLLGFYNTYVHAEIPEPCIELTPEEHAAALDCHANTVVDGQLLYIEPELTFEQLETRAKRHRDETSESPVECFGVEWDVDAKSRDNINNTLGVAERNSYPDGSTVNWILADNSLRATTAAELGQVLDAYAYRLEEVYAQYAAWRASGILEPFEYLPGG